MLALLATIIGKFSILVSFIITYNESFTTLTLRSPHDA